MPLKYMAACSIRVHACFSSLRHNNSNYYKVISRLLLSAETVGAGFTGKIWMLNNRNSWWDKFLLCAMNIRWTIKMSKVGKCCYQALNTCIYLCVYECVLAWEDVSNWNDRINIASKKNTKENVAFRYFYLRLHPKKEKYKIEHLKVGTIAAT